METTSAMVATGFPYVIAAFWISGGIIFSAGVQAALVGLTGGARKLNLAFALTCLCAAGFQMTSAAYYLAGTVAEAASSLRWQACFVAAFLPAFFLFVALYTEQKKFAWPLAVIVLLCGAVFILNLGSPYSIRFSSLEAAPPLVLPWGESLSQFAGTSSTESWLVRALFLALLGWAIWRPLVQYQRGRRRAALFLLSCALLMLAAALWGAVIDAGRVKGVYLAAFAFLGYAVAMSVSLGLELRDRNAALMDEIERRKSAEAELKQLNEELEQRVAQRSEQLRAARDEADRANQAKSEFLSRMSHELRTPMTAVLGFSQIMQTDKDLSQDHKRSVQEILWAGRHLLELINEGLDLAKIESGHIALSPELLEVSVLAAECLSLLRPLADKRSIRFDAINVDGARVVADRMRFKQVLLNLVSNAIKYNREGGGVKLEVRPAGPERLRILVTDSGPGIPASRLGDLFKPFCRLGNEGNAIEGTGLGLTITRRLIELMGGSIEVESQVGLGSTFWIELPTGVAEGS